MYSLHLSISWFFIFLPPPTHTPQETKLFGQTVWFLFTLFHISVVPFISDCFPLQVSVSKISHSLFGLIYAYIFPIGLKFGHWPSENIVNKKFHSNYNFVDFCHVNWSIILFFFFFLPHNFSQLGSHLFCNTFWYSITLIDFSYCTNSPMPNAEKNGFTYSYGSLW